MEDVGRWRPSGAVIVTLGFLFVGALIGLPWSGGVKNNEGSGAMVHGFVNSAIEIGGGVGPDELAELAIELEVAPEITEASLRRVVSGLLQRAEAGDPQAAQVVLEIARRQREDR